MQVPAHTSPLLPGQDRERTDTLPSADAFALSPFHDASVNERLPDLPTAPLIARAADTRKHVRRLRRRPGFALLADSVLLLRTVQLDLDAPVSWPAYARQCLRHWLQQISGKPLDPDRLIVHLRSAHTWVDEHDREHDSLALSLSQLAILAGDMHQLRQLAHSTPIDDTPLADIPLLHISELLRQLFDQPWADHYQQQLDRFWQGHARTWQQLARVSWLDELARQFRRRLIHREGYQLALDALGHDRLPDSPQALLQTRPARSALVWLLYLDEEVVPGLFQVRSALTTHCFIYRPGSGLPVIEYISDDSTYMAQRLLAALNDSSAHRQWLYHQQPLRIEARQHDGDLLQALQRASQRAAESFWQPGHERFMWRGIKPALALTCAAGLWQPHPAILDTLPTPLNTARERMREWLQEVHGLDLDPSQVFVAWRPGHQRTPLGHVRQAGSRIHTPDTRPLNLAKALVSRFQARQPEGYIDEGGSWAIWHDASGKGRWLADKQLPVSAEQLAAHVSSIDFLSLMTERIDTFWNQQQVPIEQTLRASLINQAVVALKLGHVQRSGFDRVVEALSDPAAHWKVLGFRVQSAFIEGMQHQPCAGLLLLAPPGRTLRVLYQAGQLHAFREFADETALHRYLKDAMADAHWRTTVMRYVPERHHPRLDYLFRFWAGQATLQPLASILRPWSDAFYHPDRHKTADQSLYAQTLAAGQPFAFMCQRLKDNALEHARSRIVTPGQQALRYWSEQLRHLQWLLAPMSLLLTPGALAALATEVGLLGLDIAMARLPGPRQAEQRQVILSLLSVGLWRSAPFTPRLSGALHKATHNTRLPIRRPSPARGAFLSLGGPTSARQTRLEPFFHTGSLLKRWTLTGSRYGGLPIHAWKLGRRFLIWTSDRGQARTLVVSTHGYYLPWSKTVKIPNGTEIHTYAPHGHVLIDPGLHKVVSQRIGPYGISTTVGHSAALPPLMISDRLLAGTSLPGRLKNYSISKYQGSGSESYIDISRIVRNSNSGFYSGQLPPTPMDVLTVRNRFASLPPDLEALFDTLSRHGIHYDRILLVHCRCAALSGLLDRAPVYTVPAGLPMPPLTP